MIGKRVAVIAICLAVFMAGCNRQKAVNKEASHKSDLPPPVAKVSGEFLSVDDLQWYLDTRSSAGYGSGTYDQFVNERLNELITMKILARKAEQEKLDQDPSVKFAIQQILGQKLIEERVIRPVMEREVSPEEIKAYYKDHMDLYVRPKEVRVADIFISAPQDEPAEIRKMKKQKAEQIVAEAQTVASQRFGFSGLVEKYSDTHPLYKKGDTGFFNPEGSPLGLEQAFVGAAFSLANVGEVVNQPVETSRGYHIIMLVGIRPAVNEMMESVVTEIEQQIRRQEIEEKREQLVRSLFSETPVETFDKSIENVVLQAKSDGSGMKIINEQNSAGFLNLQGLN